MASNFKGWDEVARLLRETVDEQERIATEEERTPPKKGESKLWLNHGPQKSVCAVAARLPNNGVIIADEVGMGKTRIVVAAISAVVNAGGRVAVVVPPGLGFQWHDELRDGGVKDVPPILRSYWSYLQAWGAENAKDHRPWFEQQVVVLSHAFANWRPSAKSVWRRALLPEVYAQWRKLSGRVPQSYHGNEELSDPWVKNAAKSIVEFVHPNVGHPGRRFLELVAEKFKWTRSLEGDYGQGSDLRMWLEKTVGLGLGFFDLVVIDEAHKSRGTDSGLSRLLTSIICTYDEHARRICMTATPVELKVAQWIDPLKRIGVQSPELETLQTIIEQYAEAIRKLRYSWRESEQSRTDFGQAARSFQDALQPFVLRRDKREDEHVRKFHTIAGRLQSYRHQSERLVDVAKLSPEWKQAVCGAEALSFLARPAEDDAATQRLRLTLGNGHGIATFLDHARNVSSPDEGQESVNGEMLPDERANREYSETDLHDHKRRQRTDWWRNIVQQGFVSKDNALFDHPILREAVDAIESFTSPNKREKVLVFGRFTEPMRALTSLLNAREMLRRIYRDHPWPQSKVHESEHESEWPAVRAAWKQLRNELSLPVLDGEKLDRKLAEQYDHLERSREKFRDSLIKRLAEGLCEIGVKQESQCHTAYTALCQSATIPSNDDLALVARALIELSGGASQKSVDWMEKVSSRALAVAFREMIDSALDRDDPDADEDGDGKIGDSELDRFWEILVERIKDEYGGNQGGFARFMYGQTKPSSRRLIQQAFNRRACFPQVLVAQSMVGREGLNLHKACKTVVLLHPEWNPGIVEQQIGRVDRVNSHWCKLLDAHLDEAAPKKNTASEECPRIDVIPIIFKGTYDEHNWNVLQQRWDDLRAQLHGVVIPRRQADADQEGLSILKELEERAPCFSPGN